MFVWCHNIKILECCWFYFVLVNNLEPNQAYNTKASQNKVMILMPMDDKNFVNQNRKLKNGYL